MSSKRNVLVGAQRPRVRLVPRGVGHEADDAISLASGYGLAPDDWQEFVLRGWLGLKRDGRWAAARCGLAVPRQNGKNGVLEIRELYGMVFRGEKFLHTAHEVKTARKAFLRLLHFLDNPRMYPELAERVREIRRTNGQEAIFLHNGGSVEFIARSKGSGRGFTVDVLVCDEAQELSDGTFAALRPTISAAPSGNPQLILTGTPPAPLMNGEVFTRMRTAGIAGKDKRLCWTEWSCPSEVDPDDLASIAQANPSVGADRISELTLDTILDERAEMDRETYCRERLGVWDEISEMVGQAIDPEEWRNTTDAASSVETLVAFGVAVALDRSAAAIGAAGVRADDAAHIEVVAHARGTAWLIDRCVDLDQKHPGAQFVIDGGGPAAWLIAPLEALGLTVLVLSTRDIGSATGWMLDAITEQQLWHGPQPELDAAVAGARLRNIGDGMVAFGRRASSIDICPLESVNLAAHVLPNAMPLDSVSVAFV